MKRRLIVHVGTAKAGSTSIQLLLHTRARHLAGFGIHVARIDRLRLAGTANRLTRFSENQGAPTRPSDWRHLDGEIDRCAAARIVMSAETFTSPYRSAAAVAMLLELADRHGLEIEVVAYVRPQWQRIESAYSQSLRAGRTASRFDSFVAGMLNAGNRTRLDYNRVFEPFREAFGNRLRVYPVEPSRIPQGLLAHFLGVIGGDPRLAVSLPRMNARAGAKELEVRRLVSASTGIDQPQRCRLWMGWLPALFDNDAAFRGFDHSGILNIQDAFAASNARFATDYGIDVGGILFQDAVESAGPRPHRVEWSDLEIVERHRVRRYVLDHTGVDLDPGTTPPVPGWRVRKRILRFRARQWLALLRRPRCLGMIAVGSVRARRRWLRLWMQRRSD